MIAQARRITTIPSRLISRFVPAPQYLAEDNRYAAFIARNKREIRSALRIRHEVFSVELGGDASNSSGLEYDAFDFRCSHLIVIEKATGKTVGTYRLNSFESARSREGFYSANEFDLSEIADEVLAGSIEIGRACILAAHRNTKVLFLLWKALANHLARSGKRYFFGCCSIFSTDPTVGVSAYNQLKTDGHFHEQLSVPPLQNAIDVSVSALDQEKVELPSLFNMYLRIGAKVCGPPMIDHDFGTIDFFVIFDLRDMDKKYRKMFFGES
ncbi:MAG TPA: GNAT family N-acyltransferase [Pyrinomonadaceae bacterium]|nr:GNAT family N-acyltransferase [Pyrinomonadaceae bacterium]